MPYKFNTKTFTLKERHPISKARYQAACNYISQNPPLEVGPGPVQALWESRKSKLMWIII